MGISLKNKQWDKAVQATRQADLKRVRIGEPSKLEPEFFDQGIIKTSLAFESYLATELDRWAGGKAIRAYVK